MLKALKSEKNLMKSNHSMSSEKLYHTRNKSRLVELKCQSINQKSRSWLDKECCVGL